MVSGSTVALAMRTRGTHFDPRVVDTFFGRLDDVLAIQTQYRDEGGITG